QPRADSIEGKPNRGQREELEIDTDAAIAADLWADEQGEERAHAPNRSQEQGCKVEQGEPLVWALVMPAREQANQKKKETHGSDDADPHDAVSAQQRRGRCVALLQARRGREPMPHYWQHELCELQPIDFRFAWISKGHLRIPPVPVRVSDARKDLSCQRAQD